MTPTHQRGCAKPSPCAHVLRGTASSSSVWRRVSCGMLHPRCSGNGLADVQVPSNGLHVQMTRWMAGFGAFWPADVPNSLQMPGLRRGQDPLPTYGPRLPKGSTPPPPRFFLRGGLFRGSSVCTFRLVGGKNAERRRADGSTASLSAVQTRRPGLSGGGHLRILSGPTQDTEHRGADRCHRMGGGKGKIVERLSRVQHARTPVRIPVPILAIPISIHRCACTTWERPQR